MATLMPGCWHETCVCCKLAIKNIVAELARMYVCTCVCVAAAGKAISLSVTHTQSVFKDAAREEAAIVVIVSIVD